MLKWGETDLTKVSKYARGGSNFLEFVEVETGIPKKIRLVGNPIVLACHWVTFNMPNGNSLTLPINCARWIPSELVFDENSECMLDEHELPDRCSYGDEQGVEASLSAYSICIDRDLQNKGEVPFAKIRLPISVFNEIERNAQDTDWGSPSGDEAGYDMTLMKIKKRGSGSGWQGVNWQKPIFSRRNTPLAEEELVWRTYQEDFDESHKHMSNDEIMAFINELLYRDDNAMRFPPAEENDEPNPNIIGSMKPESRESPAQSTTKREEAPEKLEAPDLDTSSDDDILKQFSDILSNTTNDEKKEIAIDDIPF